MSSKSQKNFLIIKLSSLGDIVHALPTARTLRQEYPDAFIAWVVEERYQELLHENPDIDEIITLRTKFWRKNWNRETLKEILQTIKSLRQHKFDMAFDFHGLIKSGLVAMASGARIKVGFHKKNCKEKISSVFTNKKGPAIGSGIHVVDMYLTLVQSALNTQKEVKQFPLPSAPSPKVEDFFQSNSELTKKPIVGINPGAGFESKLWDLERFAELADRIAVEMNCSILLTWGPGEEQKTERIAASMKQKCWVAPPTTIKESISLYKHLTLLVSCDSGPLHLCAALGIPTVSLFGPTDPARNGAYGLHHGTVYKLLSCSFCWKRKCPLGTNECMKQVTAEEVFETIRSNQNSNN
ncbi:MAG: lipopolysaccharide heptosyltransferase I [Nitrospinae bacterium]|nr:lipopolysaccharide heptosyltransferase I [Nitrospinota bacterium]